MNEDRIEELKNALREVIGLVTQRNEPINPELKAMLAQVMEHVASRIQELRQEEFSEEEIPPVVPPSGNKVTLSRPMPSSNIHSFGYDDKTGKLLVKFQGDYPQQNGPVYGYEGVPPMIFELFKRGAVSAKTDGQNKWGKWWKGKNPSLGAAMYSLIKQGGYPYQRLT